MPGDLGFLGVVQNTTNQHKMNRLNWLSSG
jgi:hypothetical protein